MSHSQSYLILLIERFRVQCHMFDGQSGTGPLSVSGLYFFPVSIIPQKLQIHLVKYEHTVSQCSGTQSYNTVTSIKQKEWVEVKLHTFDTLAIYYMKCCTFGERALGTHWINRQFGWRLQVTCWLHYHSFAKTHLLSLSVSQYIVATDLNKG